MAKIVLKCRCCGVQKDKHELAEELDIPFRDMRVVDPLVSFW
jgi:hypothetical protein